MAKYLYDRAEYARPWKLVTLAFGIAFLIAGALWSGLPDWDISISLIMAIPTYFTAPSSLRSIVERRWEHWPLTIFWTWLSVDGTYAIYWGWQDPAVLADLRLANAGVSLALYGMCGLVWYPKASLQEISRFGFKSAP